MRAPGRRELAAFLAEDVGGGDVTGALLEPRRVRAAVVSRADCTVSGTRHAKGIFALRGCRATARIREGGRARAGSRIMQVSGDVRDVLACERTALNLLARMCGIATAARRMRSLMPPSVQLLATRKTAPGLRYFDKQAVEAGGGRAHRMGLYDAVLIKDNHVAAGPQVEEMLRRSRGRAQVEVESLAGAVRVARAGARAMLIDNRTPAQVSRIVGRLADLGLRRGLFIEASGGITERNVARYSRTGVDAVSSGALTSSAASADLSLEIEWATPWWAPADAPDPAL